MASTLKTLFENHLIDLKDVCPTLTENIFVCPICVDVYNFSDTQNGKLTRGDVWPKYIREKSRNIKHPIVLLCKSCNNRAGQYGDAQMGLMEQIKDGDERGEFFGRRRITLKRENEEPIIINANAEIDQENKSITISGNVDKNLRWIGNDPKMQKRFENLVGDKQPINIHIDTLPQQSLVPKPELASVGWVTSAYLFAFYTFGYRYTLHSALDPVREYILSSFNEEHHKNLKATYPSFELREYKSKVVDVPTLEIIVDLGEKPVLHIDISRYQIRLPFPCSIPILLNMIYARMPDVYEQISKLKESGDHIYFQLRHSKANCRECILDYLLGKPATTKM